MVEYGCQYVRVVKEADSKSVGFSRAGSNPAADVFITICLNKVLVDLFFLDFL